MPGGQGGQLFRLNLPSGTQLSAIQLRCANRLDQIQLEYKYHNGNTGLTESRGGTGGIPYTFYLEEGLFSNIWLGVWCLCRIPLTVSLKVSGR